MEIARTRLKLLDVFLGGHFIFESLNQGWYADFLLKFMLTFSKNSAYPGLEYRWLNLNRHQINAPECIQKLRFTKYLKSTFVVFCQHFFNVKLYLKIKVANLSLVFLFYNVILHLTLIGFQINNFYFVINFQCSKIPSYMILL